MYPRLLGFDDSSYILFFCLGIIIAIIVAIVYLKIRKFPKGAILDLAICACFAIIFGVIFSILFENLYEVIANPENFKFSFKMTFFGGLFGGVIGFLFPYFLFLRKKTKLKILDVMIIAPASICIAHAFGRIGCFLSGCCYGIHSNGVLGMYFPSANDVLVPVQLMEAIYLFILGIVLLVLAFKKNFIYNFIIYLIWYPMFRFVIEFFRDDPRGVSGVLSPSQIWCIVLYLLIFPLFILINKIASNYHYERSEVSSS